MHHLQISVIHDS